MVELFNPSRIDINIKKQNVTTVYIHNRECFIQIINNMLFITGETQDLIRVIKQSYINNIPLCCLIMNFTNYKPITNYVGEDKYSIILDTKILKKTIKYRGITNEILGWDIGKHKY